MKTTRQVAINRSSDEYGLVLVSGQAAQTAKHLTSFNNSGSESTGVAFHPILHGMNRCVEWIPLSNQQNIK